MSNEYIYSRQSTNHSHLYVEEVPAGSRCAGQALQSPLWRKGRTEILGGRGLSCRKSLPGKIKDSLHPGNAEFNQGFCASFIERSDTRPGVRQIFYHPGRQHKVNDRIGVYIQGTAYEYKRDKVNRRHRYLLGRRSDEGQRELLEGFDSYYQERVIGNHNNIQSRVGIGSGLPAFHIAHPSGLRNRGGVLCG